MAVPVCSQYRFISFHFVALHSSAVKSRIKLQKSSTCQELHPFVSNFVAMATRVGCGKILLAVFDGPTLKTHLGRQTQRSRRYLQEKLSYSPFCPKFRCRGNQGKSGVNLNDTVRLAIPENHTRTKNYDSISFTAKVMTV